MQMPTPTVHFVDLENVAKHAPIEKIATRGNKAIIFVGATQSPPDEWLIPGAFNIEWVQIQRVAKDNLDFHLVLWVGFHHARIAKEVEFVIWTGDKGMDDAFNTMTGRKISRIDPRPQNKQRAKRKQITAPKIKQSNPKKGKHTIANVSKRCIEILQKTQSPNRPRKKSGLINQIEQWKKGINFPQQSEQIFDWLLRNGTISLGEHNKISYNL